MVQVVCNNCHSTNIKSRTNYSHGKKSSSITSFICKNCSSSNVTVSSPNKRPGRRK